MLKIGKLSFFLATLNFQELIVMKVDSKSSWIEIKISSGKVFIKKKKTKKNEMGKCHQV